MLLVELPLFLRTGLGADLATLTVLTSLPFLANWAWALVWATAMDSARAKVGTCRASNEGPHALLGLSPG